VENEFTTFSILTGEKLLYGRYVKNIDENLETIENVKSELEDALQSDPKDKEQVEQERDKEFNSSIAGKNDSDEFDDSISDIRDSLDDIDKSLDDKSLDTLDTLDDLNDLQDLGTSLEDSDNRVDLNKVEGSIEKEGLQGKEEKAEEDIMNENLTKEIDNIVDEVEQEGVKVERDEEEIPVLDKNFIYQQIKKSIKEFYDSELYEPDFIGKAYLITNVDFDPQFTEKLTDEMGFHFEQVGVDTPKLIAKLAIDEAGYEI
jgi:membrane-associated HD superfamily phosphohydrolase